MYVYYNSKLFFSLSACAKHKFVQPGSHCSVQAIQIVVQSSYCMLTYIKLTWIVEVKFEPWNYSRVHWMEWQLDEGLNGIVAK